MFNKKYCKIPLDKFIENALYHPRKGYYMKHYPFGKDGDFTTAPNISWIFSEMFYLWMFSYWKTFHENEEINIVELGAGNGEMMYHIIRSAKRFKNFYRNSSFIIYEKSNKLIRLQKKKLQKNHVKWINDLNEVKDKPTIFFGNEFLDAFPIKQFVNLKGEWHEKYVEKIGKNFSFIKIKKNIDKLERQLNFKVSKNQKVVEVSFEIIKFLKKLNNLIEKKGGCILFIDYAYSGFQMQDTLQAVKKHKKVNPLKDVGNIDISHVINISFLKKIAKKIDLELDFNTQRDFLLKLGILQRAEILATNKNFLEKANIFYRINRLIDKKQMGELFKVIYLYKKNKKFKLGFK